MALPYLVLLCSISLTILVGHGGWKAAAREVPVEYLYPPYNLTYVNYIDTNGAFLRSPNATFSAAVYNAAGGGSDDGLTRSFFSVLHDASRTPVWTATSGATILQSIVLSLTASGIALSDPSDQLSPPAWSTPAHLAAPVAALRLLDTGQLLLLDAANATLWSSFDAPTDTLLPGMMLPVGVPLTATASDSDLTPGAYRLVLTASDALLQWRTSSGPANNGEGGGDFVTYWALSSDAASVQDSNQAVHSMKVNATGIYLLADNGLDPVFTLLFTGDSTSKKLLKVGSSGRLRALSMAYSPTAARATLPAVWSAPATDCGLPLPCGSLGLCTPGNNGSSCVCPDAFSTHTTGGCAPADGAALPVPAQACHAASSPASYGYTSMGDGVGYFGSKFAAPATSGEGLPACRGLCSANCSCLGFLYKNSSRSCFLLHHQIGSVIRASSSTNGDAAGFVKTIPPASSSRGSSSSGLSTITIVFGIVLPTIAGVFITFLLAVLAVQWLKNRRGPDGGNKKKKKKPAHGSHGSSWFMLKMMSSSRASSNVPSEKGDHEDEDDDEVLIPGLPTRFTFADLEAATGGFRSQIGSGGFGSVYRGELPDGTTVAVKRMNNLGTQGRREFLTEIAVIGNVHHVNLVKLRGFCADHSRQLMLVYEFMSRGSLDHSLFARSAAGNKKPPPVLLEWPERVGVCVGAARGLAYLHAGCDRKILHCDVKPENILLDARGGVKIADFGLAKLLSPEQSGLFTTMRGTRGYLAPEWLTNAPVTDKADVYSFGMVLLEIIRGAKNSRLIAQDEEHASSSGSVVSAGAGSASSSGTGSCYFPAVALEAHEQGGPSWQRYAELADPRLEGRADAAEVARVVRVALCCLHEDASLRPAMTAVAAMLDGSMEVCEPRAEQLTYLRMYGRGIVGGGKWKGSGITTGDGASSSWSRPSCVSAQQLSAPR